MTRKPNKPASELEKEIRGIINHIGDDPDGEGLDKTPERYLNFLREFLNPPTFEFTTFDNEGMDEMIVQTHIPFHSLCEHHIAPFFGFAHVCYIPVNRIVGLSKLARTVEFHSRALQNQERITHQIANTLKDELNPAGVGVVLKAQHLCMEMRGVRKPNTYTVTSKMTGTLRDQHEARNEFFQLIELNNK
jgi:GTP cyclohydrolase I